LLDKFGICKARTKDHCRNLYCKICICKKVNESRRELREYRRLRRDKPPTILRPREAPPVYNTPPIERMKKAIANGARTQRQIRRAARLTENQLSECLAALLLWTREIRSEMVGNQRHYFLNTNVVPRPIPQDLDLPQRKPDVRACATVVPALEAIAAGRTKVA
jgi:hypothetical protein